MTVLPIWTMDQKETRTGKPQGQIVNRFALDQSVIASAPDATAIGSKAAPPVRV